MAHSHDHDHSHGDHRLEHVCTLIISGLLGLVCVLLYQKNALNLILAKQFHIPVLLGGISLLGLVALSAVAGLMAPKSKADCEGEACDSHGQCDHEHHHEHAHVHGHGDETIRMPAHEHTHEHEVTHEHVVACDHDHEHEHGHTHEHGVACDHDHNHEHGHTQDHEHAHAHGGHDHGHDHGWNPWRYIVLLLPVVLYFLNLPNSGFSASYMMRGMHTGELDSGAAIGRSVENTGLRIDKPTGQDYPLVAALTEGGPAAKAGLQLKDALVSVTRTTDNEGKPLAKPETIDFKGMPIEQVIASMGGKPQTKFNLAIERGTEKQNVDITRKADVIDLQFLELNDAALSPERRGFYAGKIGRLKGQFLPQNGRMFSLARIRIRCCAADTTTLNIIILLDDKVPPSVLEKIKPQDWIQVTGEIQFRKRKDRDEYATVMLVSHASDIQPTDPDPEVYLTQ